jgi:hypothetical protein
MNIQIRPLLFKRDVFEAYHSPEKGANNAATILKKRNAKPKCRTRAISRALPVPNGIQSAIRVCTI